MIDVTLFQNEDVLIDRTAFEGCEALDEETLAFIQSHVLSDSTVDINSRASGPAGRLSNYTERHFTFDGMECRSIEGVLQSLKCPDPAIQREICLLTGAWAKKAGGQYEWRGNQMLYWQGKLIPGAAMNMVDCWTGSMTGCLNRMPRSGRIWRHCGGKRKGSFQG